MAVPMRAGLLLKIAMVGVVLGGEALGCTLEGLWHYGDEEYTLHMDSKGAQLGGLTATVVPEHKGHCT